VFLSLKSPLIRHESDFFRKEHTGLTKGSKRGSKWTQEGAAKFYLFVLTLKLQQQQQLLRPEKSACGAGGGGWVGLFKNEKRHLLRAIRRISCLRTL
jgi:hypothetical protein